MKPTKAEAALVMMLDGFWSCYDFDMGLDIETRKKILAIRDEIAQRYPDIYRIKLEDAE